MHAGAYPLFTFLRTKEFQKNSKNFPQQLGTPTYKIPKNNISKTQHLGRIRSFPRIPLHARLETP